MSASICRKYKRTLGTGWRTPSPHGTTRISPASVRSPGACTSPPPSQPANSAPIHSTPIHSSTPPPAGGSQLGVSREHSGQCPPSAPRCPGTPPEPKRAKFSHTTTPPSSHLYPTGHAHSSPNIALASSPVCLTPRPAAATSPPKAPRGSPGPSTTPPEGALDWSTAASRPLCECCRSPCPEGRLPCPEGGRDDPGGRGEGALGAHQGNEAGQAEEEDLLLGICPEDLNFTLNTSDPAHLRPECVSTRLPEPRDTGYGGPHPPLMVDQAPRRREEEGSTVAVVSFDVQGEKARREGGVPSRHRSSRGPPAGDVQCEVTMETGAGLPLGRYPSDLFYGLPMEVEACLQEYRGISRLYGECSVLADSAGTIPTVQIGLQIWLVIT